MHYIVVCYVYKLNTVLLRTMKSCKTKDMLQAFESMYNELEEKGHKPTLHVLDNEYSRPVKKFLLKKDTDIQIVEAHNHAVLAAETAVKSAKYHTVAHLATIDPNCPTFNVGASSFPRSRSPSTSYKPRGWIQKKSAYEALKGRKFDWNRTPIAPVGSRALSFLPSSVRNTFQAHAINTWYVGMSMLHYREMYFNNPTTGYCTSSGTYKLFPTHSCMLTISENNHTIMADTDPLEMFKKIVPVSVIEKRNRCKILSSLANVLTKHQRLRRNR